MGREGERGGERSRRVGERGRGGGGREEQESRREGERGRGERGAGE